MGRLEIVEHEVDGVCGSADEDNLKDGVVQRFRLVKGPDKVDISRQVDDEVKELGFERDARRALVIVRCATTIAMGCHVRLMFSSYAARSKSKTGGINPLGAWSAFATKPHHLIPRHLRKHSANTTQGANTDLPSSRKRFMMAARRVLPVSELCA